MLAQKKIVVICLPKNKFIMKHFTLTICSAAILLFSCNNNGEKTDAAKKDSTATTMTAQTPAKEVAPSPMPDSATMMKNWQAYSTPGDMHKMMASWNGTWSGDITMWEKPGAPPSKSTGTAVNKMIFGGRYMESTHSGNMMGMPFEGHAMLAYDNAKKIFQNTWIDNMGSGIMMMSGPWDAATKSMTLTGKGMDPGTLSERDYKEKFTVIDDNTQLMEMFTAGPDGKEMKMMEIKSTRKK